MLPGISSSPMGIGGPSRHLARMQEEDSSDGKIKRLGRMSMSTYLSWSKADENRQRGVEVRREEAALKARLQASHLKYQEEQKKIRPNGQLELAGKAVSDYRVVLAQRGVEGRNEVAALLTQKCEMDVLWHERTAINTKMHGAVQRSKTAAAKQENLEARKKKALEAKQAAAQRQEELNARQRQVFEERKAQLNRQRREQRAAAGAIDEVSAPLQP